MSRMRRGCSKHRREMKYTRRLGGDKVGSNISRELNDDVRGRDAQELKGG